jgi:hypothetical protein
MHCLVEATPKARVEAVCASLPDVCARCVRLLFWYVLIVDLFLHGVSFRFVLCRLGFVCYRYFILLLRPSFLLAALVAYPFCRLVLSLSVNYFLRCVVLHGSFVLCCLLSCDTDLVFWILPRLFGYTVSDFLSFCLVTQFLVSWNSEPYRHYLVRHVLPFFWLGVA